VVEYFWDMRWLLLVLFLIPAYSGKSKECFYSRVLPNSMGFVQIRLFFPRRQWLNLETQFDKIRPRFYFIFVLLAMMHFHLSHLLR